MNTYHYCAWAMTEEGQGFGDGLIVLSEPIGPHNFEGVRDAIKEKMRLPKEKTITITSLTRL